MERAMPILLLATCLGAGVFFFDMTAAYGDPNIDYRTYENLTIQNKTACPIKVDYQYDNNTGKEQRVGPESSNVLASSTVTADGPIMGATVMKEVPVSVDVTLQCKDKEMQAQKEMNFTVSNTAEITTKEIVATVERNEQNELVISFNG